MNISVIGIDIAKAVFYLVGIDEKGCVIYRVKVKRAQQLKTLANIPVCVVAMEACGSSNYWAREIGKLGFEVKLHEESEKLTEVVYELMLELKAELEYLDSMVAKLEARIHELSRQTECYQRLLKDEGVGVLSASAIIASVGSALDFKNGRHFAA